MNNHTMHDHIKPSCPTKTVDAPVNGISPWQLSGSDWSWRSQPRPRIQAMTPNNLSGLPTIHELFTWQIVALLTFLLLGATMQMGEQYFKFSPQQEMSIHTRVTQIPISRFAH